MIAARFPELHDGIEVTDEVFESTMNVAFDRAIALYFHPDGTDGWDLWDASKLTPISASYATLAFEGTRDGNPILKAQESRPYEATTFSVPMALTAVGTGTAFTLRWPQMTNVPATWTMTLQDVVTGTTVDIRTTDHYDFTATPSAAAGTPELEKAATLLLLPDLLGYWLTGEVGAERTNASTTGLYDVRSRSWATELADLVGVPSATG